MKFRSKQSIVIFIALAILGFIFFPTSAHVPRRINITMATNGLPCLFGIPLNAGVSRDFIYWTVNHTGLRVQVTLDAKYARDSATESNLVQTLKDLERDGYIKIDHEN